VSAADVVWSSPSRDESGTMPLGNGAVGVNAWVEPDGVLRFYVARDDSFDEAARLLKLGLIEVSLAPNLLTAGCDFRQALTLEDATVRVEMAGAAIRLWVEAEAPVVHVEVTSPQPTRCKVHLHTWRKGTRQLEGQELHSAYGLRGRPDLAICRPDVVRDDQPDRVVWYHRNTAETCYEALMRQQSFADFLEAHPEHDPLARRTFGGMIVADAMASVDARTLRSNQAETNHHIRVYSHTSQNESEDAWLDGLETHIQRCEAEPLQTRRSRHESAWRDFWGRGFVAIEGDERAVTINQGYNLQRYINAIGAPGSFPVKFNGSLFTVGGKVSGAAPETEAFDADYRRWGGHYWHQNTRLAYWAMLGCGDFHLMPNFFKLYADQLPLARLRSQRYYSHDGAVFPETMTIFGTFAGDNYGWDRTDMQPGEMPSEHMRLHVCGALETVAIMVEHYRYTEDARFAEQTLLPFADAVLSFYENHYPRDEQGRLRLEPSQALETWQETLNPVPDVAGLDFVLRGLLELPADVLNPTSRSRFEALLGCMPDLPVMTLGERRERMANQLEAERNAEHPGDTRTVPADPDPSQRVLMPAEQVRGKRTNWENAELYAVFPYRRFQIGKDDLDVGRSSYAMRHEIVPLPGWIVEAFGTRFNGWTQDDAHAALLGLTDEAAQGVYERFSTKHAGSRFPAFWGPNCDWVPDQDHGSVGMIAVNFMLLQAVEGKLHVLPAWPKEWDVHFKLPAPGQTTVELAYRDGALQQLDVTPEHRAAEIVLPGWLGATHSKP